MAFSPGRYLLGRDGGVTVSAGRWTRVWCGSRAILQVMPVL